MSLVKKILNEASGGHKNRTAEKISLDDLKAKIEEELYDEEYEEYGSINFYDLPDQISKDIDDVQFDFENTEYEKDEGFRGLPCGYRTLSNGMPALFVNAGGDWETPIAFILYWDGSKVRGYVPKEGNLFDTQLMMAYGNESEAPKGLEPDFAKMEEDIANNIEFA